MDYIKEIAEAMSANHAAVMIGAGFSKNADKISSTDKWFKNWNELSDMFYETVYGNAGPGKEYNSSLRLAQEVEITVGRPKLENILKEAVPDEDYGPSEVYTKLMELPWRDVFTTNYDTLLERAADKVSKRRYNVVVNQEDLVNSNDAPRILKLHGSFPSQRPFIITEEDYRTYPIKFAAMVNTVQQALLENVFCMIGFSCEDPNFLSWIGWIHDNLGKSSSQKIYMISIEHISEAKQKLLFDKNIIVVDLQELYPEKEIPERLKSFFENLRKLIEEKDKKGYLFLEEYHPPGFDGAPGETGFRVQPLDKTCRELNRKYVMPLGYALNNLLITNWDNQNYTELDFYDLYEKMYYMKYGKQVPYEANYGGAEYEVPKDEFEEVIKTYLPFSNSEIEKGTFYNSENRTFRYRPRGLYDCEFPYEPYSEVISYEKLQDGTLKLTIEAVWEIRMLDQAITSELMIKPMEDGSFQYLSNKVIRSDQNANAGWYMPRLTEEEWEENYSNN